MPELKNNKHELFCQNIAKGDNQTQAYINAGYKCNKDTARAKAPLLVAKDSIKKRIEELQKANSEQFRATTRDFIEKEILAVMKSSKVPDSDIIDDKTAYLKALDMLNKMGGNYSEKKILEGGDKPIDNELRIIFED